ncbi:tail protein [Caulobacter phage CcrSC]|uniref:receptor protein-tyrosine kinase n=1 Tax=Caulobacter phage CcrSC TaxID=2283272 RepID=A0A385EDF1_9CAUD|nr:tail protein [Caulobacter phage CcrSC]AXQ69716.1 tail protein [Caulobacter phage CcrSC]
MVDLVAGTPASVAYTGASVDYVVKAAGQVDIHLWGGAGAGGYYANGSGNANKFGGAGGYTNVRFMASVGDVISVEVGQGGRVPTGSGTTTSAGGLGGWPDGGFGAPNSGAAWVAPGGGGGSTRIYRNGELIAVAGGGGGATGFYGGGNGGGALGFASTDASSGAGGTQLAGGVAGSGTLAVQSGGYFRGGQASTSATTSNAYTGGGGGGGYYGGASNGGGSGAHGSGGGGSGWMTQATDIAGVCRAAPQDGTGAPINPAAISIPAGTAQGGTNNIATGQWGAITPGGNGFAFLTLTDIAAFAPDLPTGSTTVSYTGTRQTYVVDSACSVDFEMWGGGGGGGFYTSGGNAARWGGAAGYTKLTRILYPGDVVEIEVAQGGQAPSGVSQTGGAGGWPNGGAGGRPSAAAPNFGGGGGSTNVWVNGRLLAIAAGGGGSTGFYYGGAGGGRFGLQSSDQTTNNGTGGTWGGVNTTSSQGRGYFLLGGHGSPIESSTIIHANAGAGGGGGYYGGGGAKGGSGTHGSGGGGCGYVSGDNTYNRVMQAGTPATGQPYDPGTKPAGVGVGGVGGNSAGTTGPGGNGACLLTVTPLTGLPTLPTGKTVFSFTNAAEHYVAGNYGVMALKVWGAGGGGCTRSSGTLRRGGGGGFFRVDMVKIAPGDIVTFVVGEGGKGMPGANLGGRGGFPNGEGGNAGDATGGNGGGGGSSHVYVNGKLVGVAGGGGGGAISFDGQTGGLAGYPPSGDGFDKTGASLYAGGYSGQRGAEGNNRGVFMLAGMGQIDGATLDTPNNLCGGGGGGGYYGGAGAVPLNSRFQGGGAGTTYISSAYVGTQQAGTTSGTNITDADWGSSASVGGQGSNTVGNAITNGGHGRIVCQFDTPDLLLESASANTPVASQMQTFMVGTDGTLTLKAWGAGGGGSMMTANNGSELAGGGGYSTATLDVVKGQVVRVWTGRGGGGANYTSGASGAFVGSGGTGGWPDGGTAGMHVSGIFGGGGGSTRVYVDDVMVLVAGGGGGLGIATTTTTPGGGGGATGGNSDAPSGQNLGGLAYRGGQNTGRLTDTSTSGGPFRGGTGYWSGSTSSTSNIQFGGGGGGGLYGGAGSGGTVQSSAYWLGGAGGSGFVADGKGILADDFLRNYTSVQYSFDTNGGVADDARILDTQLLDTAPTVTTTGPKYGTQCLNFPGTGHLTANVPAIGTQDFTLEGWFNPSSVATGVMLLLGNNSIGGFSLHYYPAATTLAFRWNNAAQASDTTYTDSARQANVWAHYAVVRDINGTRVYKDGVQVMSMPGSPQNLTATTLTLGNYNAAAGASTRFAGKIDEVRLTIGTARYRNNNFKPVQFRNTFTTGLTGTSTVQAPNSGNGQPASTGVSGYLAGRGVGATVRTTTGNGNTGGDGQVNYYLLTTNVTATGPIGTVNVGGLTEAAAGAFYSLPAPGSTVVVPYSGARVNYSADDPGGARIKVEMWGAGGGGCSFNNSLTTNGGGGGGYTVYEMDLAQGDKVILQTPSGGYGSTTAGGSNATGINTGGYPDGGDGYRPAFTAFNGGGGGSARMWARGDLAAVAGGGGGSAYGSGSYDYAGGAGGGSSGGQGGYQPDGTNATYPNNGGNQSAGGSGSPNGFSGGSLDGGDGGTTINQPNNGPGGGGGYYGGGGGGAYKAAGGGSGYINTSLAGYRTGSTTGGSGNQPGGMASPNYLAGIGVGSNGKSSQVHGGNGRIVLSVITPTPANASGEIGTVNVITPPTVGYITGTPRGDLPVVQLIQMVGEFGYPAYTSGSLPTVTLAPVESNPTTSAIVIVPINDSTSINVTGVNAAPFFIDGEGVGEPPPVLLTAPEATATVPAAASGSLVDITIVAPEASVDVILPVSASGDIGTITVSPLLGETDVNNDVFPSGNIGTILAISPEGVATPGPPIAIGDLKTVTITAPTGAASAGAVITGAFVDVLLTPPEAGVDGDARGDDLEFAYVQVLPPLVSVSVYQDGETNIYADPGLILVRPAYGDLLVISDDNYFHALPDPIVITTTAPAGAAVGNIRLDGDLATVTITPPEASITIPADVQAYTGDFIILSIPPFPVTELAANINVAMPAQIVINGNDAEASNEVTVPIVGYDIVVTPPTATPTGVHAGDIGTIAITPPQGGPQIDANPAAALTTIQVEPPRFYYIPPITVIPPEGQALDAISVDLNLPLPPAIVLTPSDAGFQVGVNISLPLTTIFVSPITAMVVIAADASGALRTINVVNTNASVQVPNNASGAISTITVQAPEAYAGVPGAATGALTTVNVEPPSATVSGAVLANRPLLTITVTAPNGVGRVPAATSGDIGTITVVTPTALATTDLVNAAGDIGTITLTPPAGSATGHARGIGQIGTIIVSAPAPSITVPASPSSPIGTIIVSSPEPQAGVAVDLSLAIGTITVNPPEAAVQVIPPVETSGDIGTITVTSSPNATIAHGHNLVFPLRTINVSPPEAQASGAVDLITEQELTVILAPPVPLLYQEAQVIVGFPTIFLYAPEATALEIAEFVSVLVTPPDGYAEVPVEPGEARIRYRRSQIKGKAPASLEPREIALNEFDGVLYSRDGAGNVKPTPLGSIVGQGVPPDGGDEGQALNGALSWNEVTPVYSGPIRNAPPAGTTVPLADGVVGSSTFTPTVGFTYTRPFFVAKAMEIANLAVEVVSAGAATATCEIIHWSLTGTPGATIVSGSVSAATTGLKAVPGTATTLAPGWYAATFSVAGAAGTSYRASITPATVGPDMTTTQSTPAYVLAALEA